MFNKYVWDIYASGEGKEIINFFERNFKEEFSEEYADKICELHKVYCPSEVIKNDIHHELTDLYKAIRDGEYLLENGEYTIFSAIETLFNIFVNDGNSEKNCFKIFSYSLAFFSTYLALELNELFFPYYFKYNFNVLQNIAQEFEINLPDIPIKKDYKGRFFYYAKICEILYDFRIENNMSSSELCAFLYDFAPKYIGGTDSYIIKNLPNPKSAYLIGGEKNDLFLSDSPDIITPWQCNPDTLAGDMIVMYIKSPVSAINSVWRSVSVGFNDPFFFYYRCTYIALPQKINEITQTELKNDLVFKDLPIVRKNLQGINGVELYPSFYNRLLDMANSDLPRFEFSYSNENFALEKDVEEKIIKPFLNDLGYDKSDYVQQLYIKFGNHNHDLIPDFVIKPNFLNGDWSAFFIVEAKISVSSSKELEETRIQAQSYAKMLRAKFYVIIAKEGIWIYLNDAEKAEPILKFSCSEMKIEDNFYKIFSLLGKRKNKI